MSEEIIISSVRYVTTVLFNRPEKRNALNADALFLIGDLVREVERKKEVRVLVLRGNGNKAFCSGVDLSGGASGLNKTIEGLNYCLSGLLNCSCPVISMIFGPAIGAGLDLAVISDFRFAEEGAKFGAPLVRLGRTYYYTAIGRLTRLVGLSSAKEILFVGKLIEAEQAWHMGLVNKVVSRDDLETMTMEFARELAEDTAPLAVSATKRTIRRLFEEQPLDPTIEMELKHLADHANSSGDAEEGVKAMLDKRKPIFAGQ
jgi:enoyl-CoA hydratase